MVPVLIVPLIARTVTMVIVATLPEVAACGAHPEDRDENDKNSSTHAFLCCRSNATGQLVRRIVGYRRLGRCRSLGVNLVPVATAPQCDAIPFTRPGAPFLTFA